MNCEACGNDNRTGSRFCDRCGSPLSLRCPACGESNRGDATFCAACGTTLNHAPPIAEPSAPSAERRHVSVLFVDLVGFTSFAEGRDPERVRGLQQRYFDAATEVIERHGGTVEKFIGDAVMAVWGTPVAHEDDAQRAVRAALEVVKSVEALGHDLGARAGVATGEAAVTLGATNQGMVAGDTVNIASRLQTSADPGHVVADAATVQAVRGTIGFEVLDELHLKGKSEPIRAWRATRVQRAVVGDLVEPPFVGRADELRRLKDLLHATARDRRIRLVSIVGPAGIGKSRLVDELGLYAHGLAERTFWHSGRSPSYGERLAFWALGEMVRRRVQLAEGDEEDTTRARVDAALAEFVPSEDERAWIEPALLALLGSGDASGADSLFPAWRTFFERLADRGSVVLVFEDLQWADSGTFEFIDHLLDWSRNQPILVITLARPELLEDHAGWGTGRSNATAMALEPLSDAHMKALLDGLLPGLPDEKIHAIVRRAEGMPLYAVEMVRGLLAEGRIERRGDTFAPSGDFADLPLPVSLRSLIASRLDALDAEDRAVLQQGSVLGQAFSLDALAAVTGRSEADLQGRLRRLVRREFLEIEADPRSPERGQYRFVQGLIREVAYDTLGMRDRRSRHLAAARFLEASESDETAGALASHYVAAYRASDDGPEANAVAGQARIALRAAAERATSLGAHAQAVQSLETALGITEDPAERAELLEVARDAAMSGGIPSGPDFGRQAIEAWQAADDNGRAGRAKALYGESLIFASRMDHALSYLERESQALPDDADPAVAARLFSSVARVYMRFDRNEDAIEAADRALRLAEPRRLDEVIAHALINKGAAFAQLGRPREAAALVREGMALVGRIGLAREELRAALNLANILGPDEPLQALELLERSFERARRLGDFWFTIDFATFCAGILYCVGTPDAWQRATQTLDALVGQIDNPLAHVWLDAARISFSTARDGEFDAQMESVARAPELDPSNPFSAVATDYSGAEVALVQRNWRKALDGARAAIDQLRFVTLGVGPILLHSASRLEDADALRWFSDRLDRSGFVGAQPSAVRHRTDGALLAAQGKRREATAAFAEALDTYRHLGLQWEWARTALDALAALPHESRVREWAAEGRRIFEAIDAVSFVALTDDLLTPSAGARSATLADTPADESRASEVSE